MRRVNQVGQRGWSRLARGTEELTFGAPGTIPARARAVAASDFASVPQPKGEH
jgi:hypothetical protein